MIINKSGGFQLPSGGQMQKKYFCVQKNEAITSELSEFYCATIFGINKMFHLPHREKKAAPSGKEPLWIF